jgi:gamma-glutamyltranspeptidase
MTSLDGPRFACKATSFALIGALASLVFVPRAPRAEPVIFHAQAVTAANGMVVAQEAIAARIGAEILRKGGNAIDAAVAVGFTMAVTYPRAGNIGGGGFMVIHRANGDDTAIDYRETAPAAINKASFSTRRAMPTRKSRGTRRSASAYPARSRASRSPSKNMAPAALRSPT